MSSSTASDARPVGLPRRLHPVLRLHCTATLRAFISNPPSLSFPSPANHPPFQDDPDGLNVCLQCFNGGCAGPRHHDKLHHTTKGHPLVLNIRRTRKVRQRDEPPPKMSKLAIAAETEEDRYDTATAVRCLDCDVDLDKASPRFSTIVDGIMAASTFSRKEEVKAWEQELISCEHILMMEQAPPRAIESGDLGHCSLCDLHENLWLCLVCGNLGCGRKQMGGVEGNSHGLGHALESGHGVAVKLGSITPEGSADVYCYKCDDERIDSEIGKHLAHWGIRLAERQKTEMSLTEMQIEQNMKWDFSMTSQDGRELKPLFGPGLTGLRNLGNSCYLASIIQCLFDLPAFKSRYYDVKGALPVVVDPAADLETQLRKMGDGLWSGRYSVPDEQAPGSPSDSAAHAHYQRGLAPAMLKHLIGRGHAEFSTMRQQDAFEFLQHLFTLVTRDNHASGGEDPTRVFRFATEQRLQCGACRRVRYTTTEQDNIFIDVPKEKVEEEAGLTEGGESRPEAYRPVTLEECLDRFTGEERVELACEACGDGSAGFTKRTLFKTLPDVLAVNANKMAVVNWVPIKIDVPVLVPDGAFSFDKYMSAGLQPGEEELPAEPKGQAPAFVPEPTALAQLEGMGFPRNRCERALHATGNSDANVAMEWLFAHMEDVDIDEPLDLGAAGGGGGGGAEVDGEKVGMLVAMGFGEAQARKALRETGGDAERAVEWVFSHPEDMGDDEPAGGSGGNEKGLAGREGPGSFRLQSIVCHKGTSIHAG